MDVIHMFQFSEKGFKRKGFNFTHNNACKVGKDWVWFIVDNEIYSSGHSVTVGGECAQERGCLSLVSWKKWDSSIMNG